MTDQATPGAGAAADSEPVAAPVERRVRRQSIGTRIGCIDDLPPQVRALQSKRPATIDAARNALAALDGIATTDELLVMVYRQTGHVHVRRSFEVKLYEAVRKGAIGIRRLREGRTNPKKGIVCQAWTLTPNAELTGPRVGHRSDE